MTRMSLIRLAVCASALLPLTAAALAPEARLSAAIEHMQAGQPQEALKKLADLSAQEPQFQLGRLMYAELRAALAPAANPKTASSDAARLHDLADEARLRLASEQAVPPSGSVPSSVLELAAAHPYLIAVDLQRARLYLLENQNGQLKLLRHHYAAMGKNGYGKQAKGDNRTPLGVYHVTGWLADRKLPEKYGAGAFPVSYPNPWDVFKHRTGSGIWLHGVPRNTPAGTRPPRSSEGCVTMANDDLLALKPYMSLGRTPVLLADDLEWLEPSQSATERQQWLGRVENWRSKWAALDTEAYLGYYGSGFTAEGMNLSQFSAHKRRVNAAKKFIEVKLDEMNLFRYPGGGEPLVLVEFRMDYRSDNFQSTVRKQQFWRQESDGEWKIFREENL